MSSGDIFLFTGLPFFLLNSAPFIHMGFLCGLADKESACDARDLSSEDPLEKEKATNSCILAWRIPWTI